MQQRLEPGAKPLAPLPEPVQELGQPQQAQLRELVLLLALAQPQPRGQLGRQEPPERSLRSAASRAVPGPRAVQRAA